MIFNHGLIAQLVEHQTSNQKIVSSNLTEGKYFKKSKNFFFSVDYKCCLQVEENLLLFPGHSKTGALLSLGIVKDSSEILQIVLNSPGKKHLKHSYRKDISE